MRQIDTLTEFEKWIKQDQPEPVAVQELLLKDFENLINQKALPDSLFLGCELSDFTAGHIVQTGGVVIPQSKGLEFKAHRARLYTRHDLFEGFDPSQEDGYQKTRDYKVYAEYLSQGKDNSNSIYISLMRRLHDHSITEALMEAIEGRKVVAMMGGHSMQRSDAFYLKVARLSRKLTQEGYLMVTGGGPGAMEATHVGAHFACFPEKDMLEAIEILKVRPQNGIPGKEYADPDWLHRAWKVLEKYPIPEGNEDACMSIGIPTWLYGHEPPTPFASHIAKYFANSVREDGLLAIAKHGVIFAPGSAGTTQEIFQDATQNHYGSMEYISPMILFGKKRWTEERPIWPVLQKVSEGKMYGELIALTDDENEVVRRVLSYRPDLYKV